MSDKIVFKIIYLPQNQGHGNARRKSIENASNELIALMDADDISEPYRFEEQLKMFKNNPGLDVCGGNITEFVGDETNIIGRRVVETEDSLIKKDLKKRCPMNQVSVMMKKSAYNEAGGYIDWYCEEDYYLWTRMIEKGSMFANVEKDIVNVRTGLEMSSRRGGWKYFSSERKLQRYLLSQKFIALPRYLYNVLIRFGGEVLLPNGLRNKMFKVMREKFTEVNILKDSYERGSRNDYPQFSVVMCVYGKDNAAWFDRALESVMINQTVKPAEVVLVVDGPIPEDITRVIEKYYY